MGFPGSPSSFRLASQYLMEGSYNKVFLAKGNIPAESYTFFIDILLDTIRCVGWTQESWCWGTLTLQPPFLPFPPLVCHGQVSE